MEPRGGVSNGRYDRVRAGSGAGSEWNNRWQVLDQTGNDVEMGAEMDGNDDSFVQSGGRVDDVRERNNVTTRPRVRQPGLDSTDRGGTERVEGAIGGEGADVTDEGDGRAGDTGTMRKIWKKGPRVNMTTSGQTGRGWMNSMWGISVRR
jgi:hypothetical protein